MRAYFEEGSPRYTIRCDRDFAVEPLSSPTVRSQFLVEFRGLAGTCRGPDAVDVSRQQPWDNSDHPTD